MADGITAEIFGNIAILDHMDALDLLIQARAQEKLEEAGQMALEEADSLTPVLTGYLLSRNQLQVRPGRVIVSNDAPYAGFIVLGHLTRGHQSFVPPNDFLSPAMHDAGEWLKEQLRGMI